MNITQRKLTIFTSFLLLIVYFGWNHIIELRAEEPRRAIVSLEMFLSGDYLVPRINDYYYYNKPPLFNWMVAFCYWLFGSYEEWVVRFPSLVSLLTLGILNYYVVRKFLKKEIALFSSLFFVTSADILFYGSVNAGEIDLFFCLLVYVQLMAIFYFFDQKKFLMMFLVSYCFAALGTLTKGPPSIAFQGLTLVPWLLFHKQWKLLFHWKHFAGIFLFLIIVGGYFYAYSFHGDAVGYMLRLIHEASGKTGLEANIWDTIQSFFTFPLFIAKVLSPWIIFAIFFVRKDFWKTIQSNSILKFSVYFILFNIPIYWLTGKHSSRYIYMFYPFFCLLFAYFFIQHPPHLGVWKKRIDQLFGVVMIIATVAFLAIPFVPQLAEVSNLIWKNIFLIAGGCGLIWWYIKNPQWRMSTFIIFILLVRLGFNMLYLPALAQHSPDMIYKKHIEKVLEITGEEQIYWTGWPYIINAKAALGPLKFKEVKLTNATPQPYQVPYYITRGTGKVMKYYPKIEKPGFYLTHRSFIEPNDSLKVLYNFPDLWLKREFILFKLEEIEIGKIKGKFKN